MEQPQQITTSAGTMAQPHRSTFTPIRWDSDDKNAAVSLYFERQSIAWLPLIRCAANFPVELFVTAVLQLVHHPEYNSTLILRSETISDSNDDPMSRTNDDVPFIQDYMVVRKIHRKLLPRRPGRDHGLEQSCTLLASRTTEEIIPTVLVLEPIWDSEQPLPYYHPAVSHLALRYIQHKPAQLQIEVVPLPGTETNMNSRLYRTCLALLDTVHRYGWGALVQYKKRVVHDRIVPRNIYQDLYLVLRERHKHLVNTWQESTDPLKHVFEDIGIATFLILLWKDMYSRPDTINVDESIALDQQPWKSWPRPPKGFLDLGCGNGLLVHILTAEGYDGYGIDVRARTSWQHYPADTQSRLRVEAFDPTLLSHGDDHPFLFPGVFVIGNHADELTPWIPVVSNLCQASGYISIPCCSWALDARFERSKYNPYPVGSGLDDFVDSLFLGGDGKNASAYSQYRIWLASLSLHCGWKVECETLRIPSTRNWALIGREHTWESANDEDQTRQRVIALVNNVQDRGIFKPRRPEGKAGDH